jgi:hypothetical protein
MYSLRMLFAASACFILCLPLEKAALRQRRPTRPVFSWLVVFEIYVEDGKTALRRLRLSAEYSKLVNSAALADFGLWLLFSV